MKLELFKIGQYSNTKKYYIGKLNSVSDTYTISRIIIFDNIFTETEANAVKKHLDTLNSQLEDK